MQNALRYATTRSSAALALGFAMILGAVAFLGIQSITRARAISEEMERTQNAYQWTENLRRDVARDMYLADILVRDYLLDPSPTNAQSHREELYKIRSSLQDRLDQVKLASNEGQGTRLSTLREEVQGYWDSLDPIFEWTPQDKAEKSWLFLRKKVFPRRKAVVDLAREMAALNEENLERERQRIRASQHELEQTLLNALGVAVAFGIVVALFTTFRVSRLERRQELQRKEIQLAEQDLRQLSRRLVQAQETERTRISRELHDEVGQTLTALGIEIANLEKIRWEDPETFHRQVDATKQLNADAIRSIRDLAMGLRPSMLDDLGLEPALNWQGREFSRRTQVAVSIQVEGMVDDLPDAHRTCIYRIVQEALTNCARHAKARNVLVNVHAEDQQIVMVVQDDGVGFETNSPSGGLGLIGMKERVKELGGTLRISSQPKQGTTLRVVLPIEVAQWASLRS